MDLLCLVNEGFRRHIHAHIADFKTCALQHHNHQILSDIVQVASYGADNRPSHGFISNFHQLGLQNIQSCVQSTGCHQYLGNKDFVAFEFAADNHHSVQKSLVENLFGIHSLVQRLLHQSFHVLRAAFLQIL